MLYFGKVEQCKKTQKEYEDQPCSVTQMEAVFVQDNKSIKDTEQSITSPNSTIKSERTVTPQQNPEPISPSFLLKLMSHPAMKMSAVLLITAGAVALALGLLVITAGVGTGVLMAVGATSIGLGMQQDSLLVGINHWEIKFSLWLF